MAVRYGWAQLIYTQGNSEGCKSPMPDGAKHPYQKSQLNT